VSITGILGELLITAGVLVLLFLGWYVWLNDVVQGNLQQNAATEVQRELQEEWEQDVATDEPDPTPQESSTPLNPAELPQATAPGAGQRWGALIVPRFGEDYVRAIGEGIDMATVLNSRTLGVGRYPETQMPGELGNVALAAHRNTWGGAFGEVGELQLGDNIYVETRDGWYQYGFRNLEFVRPTAVEVLSPVPQAPEAAPGEYLLTLTTCNPRYSTAERMIAYAVLEEWHPRAGGAPAEISGLVEASSQ
jgi:sortase A